MYVSIQEKKPKYNDKLLYNATKYTKDRKAYIENRLVNEGGIDHLVLFDENYWNTPVFGDAYAVMDGEHLLIQFKPNDLYGTNSGEKHLIKLGTVSKSKIESIDFSFENCEDFEIFPSEILDMQLDFCPELCWTASGFGRQIKNGYIKWKPDPTAPRKTHMSAEWDGKRTKGVAPLIRMRQK